MGPVGDDVFRPPAVEIDHGHPGPFDWLSLALLLAFAALLWVAFADAVQASQDTGDVETEAQP